MSISPQRHHRGALVLTALLSVPALAAAAPDVTWGSYETPFAADSPWNSRPVQPEFGTYVIPKSNYWPSIASGAYSTSVFLAKASDTPMTIHGAGGKPGVWDPDAEALHEVTLPHWPAGVMGASGSDGHADIVDPVTGILYSFWQLKQQNGVWVASLYAWSKLDGTGWGSPTHYFQGARAAGVPPSAGIIRKHEVNDGQPMYRHALAVSLTFNALSRNPTYIFPATSADNNAATTNSGQIPEGALLMLPPSYDISKITNPLLHKVAATLQTYGAYVVDRNEGTPFYIYVENGADFPLQRGKWDNNVARALDDIRANLRQVVHQRGWLDGNGKPLAAAKPANLLSMRGAWHDAKGAALGQFDSASQSLVFPAGQQKVLLTNTSSTGLSKVSWAQPPAGHSCRFRVVAKGGAQLRLQVLGGGENFDSGMLNNGAGKTLPCPGAGARIVLMASSGGAGASSVQGELLDSAK